MTNTQTTKTLIDRIKLEDTSDASINMRRYNVRDEDGTHLGWVVKFASQREWTACVSGDVNETTRGYASQKATMYAVKYHAATRREAVDEITFWLENCALYGGS